MGKITDTMTLAAALPALAALTPDHLVTFHDKFLQSREKTWRGARPETWEVRNTRLCMLSPERENSMNDVAVFNAEDGLWYKPRTNWGGVKASTYPEAVEQLYGHAPIIPPVLRETRRKEEKS